MTFIALKIQQGGQLGEVKGGHAVIIDSAEKPQKRPMSLALLG